MPWTHPDEPPIPLKYEVANTPDWEIRCHNCGLMKSQHYKNEDKNTNVFDACANEKGNRCADHLKQDGLKFLETLQKQPVNTKVKTKYMKMTKKQRETAIAFINKQTEKFAKAFGYIEEAKPKEEAEQSEKIKKVINICKAAGWLANDNHVKVYSEILDFPIALHLGRENRNNNAQVSYKDAAGLAMVPLANAFNAHVYALNKVHICGGGTNNFLNEQGHIGNGGTMTHYKNEIRPANKDEIEKLSTKQLMFALVMMEK